MERLTLVRKILIFVLLILTTLCISLFSINSAYADDVKYFLPNDLSEFKDLSSPTDAFFWDENVAITQNPDTVLIYLDGVYHEVTIQGATSLTQIKKMNDNYLLVLNFGTLFKISLNNFTVTELKDSDTGYSVSCAHYDIDNGTLITAASSIDGSARIYTINDEDVTKKTGTIDKVNGTQPIAIDGEYLVYVSTNGLVLKHSITNLTQNPVELNFSEIPEVLTICGDDIYYSTSSNVIHKFTKSTGIDTVLTINNDFSNNLYDLGKFNTVTSLSIRDGKLIITDNSNNTQTSNTISEYIVDGSRLKFSGYAICYGKTAYNRIGSPNDIERHGKRVAVLDEYKLTIIDENSESPYSLERFNNIISNTTMHFALGDNSVIISDSSNKVTFIDITSSENKQEEISLRGIITDISFKCGNYYIIANNGVDSFLFTYNETSKSVTNEIVFAGHYYIGCEVTVSGQVLITDINTIYKVVNNSTTPIANIESGAKIVTDFAETIYKCYNGSIFYLENNTWIKLNISVSNINSFSFDYDDNIVYFTSTGKEFIYSTNQLNNVAINNISIPNDYVLSNTSANIDKLKVYSIDSSANVFSVNTNGSLFSFSGLITPNEKYIYICSISLKQNETYLCLSGANGIILVKDSFASLNDNLAQNTEKTVFVTTTVHAYYLPLITLDSRHQLDCNGEKLIVNKHSEIKVVSKVNVLNRDFYYCLIDEQNSIYAYVPLDFTVEVLSQNKELIKYTTKKVSNTTVYLNEDLSVKYTELNESSTVNVVSTVDNVCKIFIKTESGYIYGYISSDDILNVPAIAIRNILIILAVVACACGTASFFLLRHKKES